MLEKDTKLEIENRSSPFIPNVVPVLDFNPETPLVQVDSKKEAYSKMLFDICTNPRVPVVLMRGVASALKMDLGFFSTKNLTSSYGNLKINLHMQKREASDKWNLGKRMRYARPNFFCYRLNIRGILYMTF